VGATARRARLVRDEARHDALVRDEADIVDAQIAFHLSAAVDFVIATDNRSEDATTDVLRAIRARGRLRLLREDGDDLRQSEWVTRMARLAATEHGADWVLNADADEFWWPQGTSLHDVLAAVPEHYGVVRAAWRNFVPRPDGNAFFAERMTAAVRRRSTRIRSAPHSKSAHRAKARRPDRPGEPRGVRDRPSPCAAGTRWRSSTSRALLEHCLRKYVTQFVALERNAEGHPGHMEEAYRAYRAGRLAEFYAPLVVADDEPRPRLADGSLALDTRLATRCARSASARERETRACDPFRSPPCRRRPRTRPSTPRCRSRTSACAR
jgi:hypothetical protein